MEAKVPPKLSEALGTPDVFPFEQVGSRSLCSTAGSGGSATPRPAHAPSPLPRPAQGRPENQLSPDALLNGYRISYERDFGVSEKGELELSLCGAEEQWDAARLLAYRRVRGSAAVERSAGGTLL